MTEPSKMSDSQPLIQKEQALIDLIIADDSLTQRKLAASAGFSLGMTNLLLKRMVRKGTLKVVSLNGRTLRYMLTPSGMAQKLNRTYEYVLASIRGLNQIKARVKEIVARTAIGDPVVVIVFGSSELAQLTYEAVREAGVTPVRITGESALPDMELTESSVIFQCSGQALPKELFDCHVVELSRLLEVSS